MKELTEMQIESYKRWYNKTVKQCKTCGAVCVLLPELQEGELK